MSDVILLGSVSQEAITKQKDNMGKIFIAKHNHSSRSSIDGESWSWL